MEKIKFAVLGSGWRAEFYFKIAKEAPQVFEIVAVVEPVEERAEKVVQDWGFTIVKTAIEAKEKYGAEFIVVSKRHAKMPPLLKELSDAGLYILSETYAMPSVKELSDFYKSIKNPELIQFAEQYIFQPHHAARLKVIEKGVIGTPTQAQISAAHGYHGASLIRNYLNAGFQNCSVIAKNYQNPLIAGRGRFSEPTEEKIMQDNQFFAILDFGDKWAVFDFLGEQYLSRIRTNRILVRGEKGEILDKTVRALLDYKTPIQYDLIADIAGLEGEMSGLRTRAIVGGETIFYSNNYENARLKDDELAMAESLYKMGMYVRNGEKCYSFEEACQDQYLDLIIKNAVEAKCEISTETQVWVKEV